MPRQTRPPAKGKKVSSKSVSGRAAKPAPPQAPIPSIAEERSRQAPRSSEAGAHVIVPERLHSERSSAKAVDSVDGRYVYGVIEGKEPGEKYTTGDYTVDEKHRSCALTEEGVLKVEKLLAIGNLYDPANIEINHHVQQALKAHVLFHRDKDYLVQEGAVVAPPVMSATLLADLGREAHCTHCTLHPPLARSDR